MLLQNWKPLAGQGGPRELPHVHTGSVFQSDINSEMGRLRLDNYKCCFWAR